MPAPTTSSSAAPSSSGGGGALLDLLGFDVPPMSQPSVSMGGPSMNGITGMGNENLGMGLMDLIGGGGGALNCEFVAVTNRTGNFMQFERVDSVVIISSVLSVADTRGIPEITAFERNGLKVVFLFNRPEANNACQVSIKMMASNSNPLPIVNFVFQAAVPKVKLENNRIEWKSPHHLYIALLP